MAETDLDTLLATLAPSLKQGEFVFVTLSGGDYGDGAALRPIASIGEDEGLSLVVPETTARDAGLDYDGVYRMITLCVNSSLMAVGLTARVSAALEARGISANVIAGRHHDHVLVPADRAEDALEALLALERRA